MRINDESLDGFYPRCAICGEPIEADGYQIESEYFCEDCIAECRIDGTEVAESIRDGAFEEAQEGLYDE